MFALPRRERARCSPEVAPAHQAVPLILGPDWFEDIPGNGLGKFSVFEALYTFFDEYNRMEICEFMDEYEHNPLADRISIIHIILSIPSMSHKAFNLRYNALQVLDLHALEDDYELSPGRDGHYAVDSIYDGPLPNYILENYCHPDYKTDLYGILAVMALFDSKLRVDIAYRYYLYIRGQYVRTDEVRPLKRRRLISDTEEGELKDEAESDRDEEDESESDSKDEEAQEESDSDEDEEESQEESDSDEDGKEAQEESDSEEDEDEEESQEESDSQEEESDSAEEEEDEEENPEQASKSLTLNIFII